MPSGRAGQPTALPAAQTDEVTFAPGMRGNIILIGAKRLGMGVEELKVRVSPARLHPTCC